MTPLFYVFECGVEGADVEFYLNDIPIVRRSDDDGQTFSGPMNENLVDGENEIAMVIRHGPIPSQSLSGEDNMKQQDVPGSASAWARIAKYPRGAVVGGQGAEELLRIDWPIQDERTGRDDFQPAEYPLRLAVRKDLGALFGAWEWQSAPELQLDPLVQQEVRQLLEELHGSLAAGDPEPFINVSRIRIDEGARAYQKDPQDKIREIRSVTADESKQDWWGMEPLDEIVWDLRVVGNNKMIECVAHDWDPILRELEEPGEGRGQYAILLSRIKGQLQVVR